MMRRLASVLLAAVAMAACESGPSTDAGLDQAAKTPAVRVCKFDQQKKAYDRLLSAIQTDNLQGDAKRAFVASKAAEIRSIASTADTPSTDWPLAEIACRQLAVNAYDLLMSPRELTEEARNLRFATAQKGNETCIRLSAADRARPSATACDQFKWYTLTHPVGVELDRVVRTLKGAQVTVEVQDKVRASLETATASIQADWPMVPSGQPFGDVARAEKWVLACSLAVEASPLVQATNTDEMAAAGRRVGQALGAMTAAAAANLGVTQANFGSECRQRLQ